MVEHVLCQVYHMTFLTTSASLCWYQQCYPLTGSARNLDHCLSQVSRTDFLPGTPAFCCCIREKSGYCPMSQANLQMVLYIYIHNPLINVCAMTLPGTGLVGTDIYFSLQYKRFWLSQSFWGAGTAKIALWVFVEIATFLEGVFCPRLFGRLGQKSGQ